MRWQFYVAIAVVVGIIVALSSAGVLNDQVQNKSTEVPPTRTAEEPDPLEIRFPTSSGEEIVISLVVDEPIHLPSCDPDDPFSLLPPLPTEKEIIEFGKRFENHMEAKLYVTDRIMSPAAPIWYTGRHQNEGGQVTGNEDELEKAIDARINKWLRWLGENKELYEYWERLDKPFWDPEDSEL